MKTQSILIARLRHQNCTKSSKEVKDLSLNFSVVSAQSGFKVMEEMSKTSWLQPNINLFPKLKKLKIPTFILHGKQDIVPAWTAQEINDAISQSEIVILDQSDHFPYIKEPSQFFAELNGFLRKINQSQANKKGTNKVFYDDHH